MSFMDMFEKMKTKADKKKKERSMGLGKTRGAQTKDADETMKELEKEERNELASADE